MTKSVIKPYYRILYCAKCKWQYPGNSAGVGCVPQCSGCGGWGLHFIQTSDMSDDEIWKLRAAVVKVGLAMPKVSPEDGAGGSV